MGTVTEKLEVEANPEPGETGWLAKVRLPWGQDVVLGRCSCGCGNRRLELGPAYDWSGSGDTAQEIAEYLAKLARPRASRAELRAMAEAVGLLQTVSALL